MDEFNDFLDTFDFEGELTQPQSSIAHYVEPPQHHKEAAKKRGSEMVRSLNYYFSIISVSVIIFQFFHLLIIFDLSCAFLS